MHPEDIKATLRKRFGTISAFEDANDLPRKSVSDFLRGRPSQRVKDAIAKILPPIASDFSDGSGEKVVSHGQNAAGARADSHRLCDDAVKTRAAAR